MSAALLVLVFVTSANTRVVEIEMPHIRVCERELAKLMGKPTLSMGFCVDRSTPLWGL